MGLIRRTYTIPERKYIDTQGESALIDETAGFLLINGLQQGVTSVTRIGQRVTMKSIHLKIVVTGQQVTTAPNLNVFNNVARIMLVYDLQPNGATPLASDLLDTHTGGTAIIAPLNKQWTQRWKVLWDKRFPVMNSYTPAGGAGLAANSQIFDEVYLNLNHNVEYTNTSTGTVGDIKTGALWFVAVSNTSDTAQQPRMAYYIRIRYTDC